MERDTTARPHLPHTTRQKEKAQPRQPGHAEAGGVPHVAANEIPYLYTSHQQTVMAPAQRPEPATVLVVPNLPGQVKEEAHRRQRQKVASYLNKTIFYVKSLHNYHYETNRSYTDHAGGNPSSQPIFPAHFSSPPEIGPDQPSSPSQRPTTARKTH